MVRAAAKNHEHVGVLTSPSQYDAVLEEIVATGTLTDATRHALPERRLRTPPATTRRSSRGSIEGEPSRRADDVDGVVPPTLHLTLERAQVVRYGENPHQTGARYRFARARRRGGTASFSTPARRSRTSTFLTPTRRGDWCTSWLTTCPSVCGRNHQARQRRRARPSVPRLPARSKGPRRRWPERLRWIIAVGGELDAALASLIAAGPQADVIIASSIHPDAVDVLVKRRKATRLLSAPSPEPLALSVRTLGNTALVQNADELLVPVSEWKCVTTATPTDQQLQDLAIAWRVCARTTSNAIVIARDGVAVGIGAPTVARRVGEHRDDQGR